MLELGDGEEGDGESTPVGVPEPAVKDADDDGADAALMRTDSATGLASVTSCCAVVTSCARTDRRSLS